MKTRTTWLNEDTVCKIIIALLIYGMLAMMLAHFAVSWQERKLTKLRTMNNEIREEIGDLETKVEKQQELWAHAIIISPINIEKETEETDNEELKTLSEFEITEATEICQTVEETETTEEVFETIETTEVADEMNTEMENSEEKKTAPEITKEPETAKVVEDTPVILEVKAVDPIEPIVETPKVWTNTSAEFPYTIEDFLKWNGIDREFLIVTISKVIYVEARGVERAGKVSVGATICHWGRSGRITNLWDILSGYASISGIDYYQLIWDPIEGETMKLCREAAEAAIAGEDPAGDMMGASTYYFLDPSKSDPDNVRVMTAAYHQVWIENQLFLGYEGVDWMQK